MHPGILIPVVDPIPVPRLWFDTLLVVMFTVHILFMNTAVGAAVVALVSRFTGQKEIAKTLSKHMPAILALTINFGVAPLLFLQVVYGQFDYVSSVLMGGFWLSVIALLILAYYGLYIYDFKFSSLGGGGVVLLCGALCLMLWIGFMFSNNMTMMLNLDAWPRYFTEQGGYLNLGDGSLWARYLHHILAAPAVGGLYVAMLGHMRGNDGFVDVGLKWFTRATLVNLAAGLWFLMALPQPVMQAFMGGSMLPTATLVASLAAAGFMLAAGFQRKPVATAVWTGITVLLMALARHFIRTVTLDPYFLEHPIPVTGDYGSLTLFLGTLVFGLAMVAYMLKLALRAAKEA